ncbi:MAG: prephenate dehydratase [Chloroflexota bacterium]
MDELRDRIDELDAHIVADISQRIKVAEAIGQQKKQQGKPVNDNEREKLVLEHITSLAQAEKISPDDIAAIYQRIILACKRIQGVSVAFQGERGAYSEEAALQFFGTSIQTLPRESIDNVFEAVEKQAAEFGVVPVENSLEGSITRSYDRLLDSNLKVCGEILLRVSHCLIGLPEARLDAIRKIYSHPQALGQCQNYLRQLGAELIPTYDTAGSVKIIMEKGKADRAAVAGARAAEIYGMKILAREIEDNNHNITRFFVLAQTDSPPTGNDKTSIVFSVRHQPGALYQSLRGLADRSINLTKIESRPTRLKPWEYNFYVDLEGHREEPRFQEALENLEKTTIFVKVLGSYPRAG